jgi:SAM-dependent methyltransferase
VEAITAQHVIEHLVDPVAAAHQWFQALKPGGAALILTPNAVFTDLTIFDDPTHIRLYTPTQLCLLLRQVGFEIVESRSLGLPWFREYNSLPSGWRLRRWVTRHARGLARWPGLRWKGQTLCVAARRPMA